MPQGTHNRTGGEDGAGDPGAVTHVTGIVSSITYDVGRNGRLTPVAKVEAPEDGGRGKTIKVALPSTGSVGTMDLRVGDVVTVEKPSKGYRRIAEHHKDKRTGRETLSTPPEKCPACDTWTTTLENSSTPRCVNETCPERRAKALLHHAGPEGLGIKNLGITLCRRLIANNLVNKPEDVTLLTEGDLLGIEGVRRARAASLTEQFRALRNRLT